MTARTFARPLDAVDSLEYHVDGDDLVVLARKTVRVTDPYMAGHFPGLTLYPAIFLLEGVRQAVGSVKGDWLEVHSVRSLRIFKPMLDGDVLCLRIGVRAADKPGVVRTDLRCTRADGPLVAEISAELTKGGASQCE